MTGTCTSTSLYITQVLVSGQWLLRYNCPYALLDKLRLFLEVRSLKKSEGCLCFKIGF